MVEQLARVCVVDDDLAARQSLAALIESYGLSVTSFSSAEEFLERTIVPLEALASEEFEKCAFLNWPDCLICDLRLTGMSGISLQEELVRRGFFIPVIIITAYSSTKSAVQAFESGVLTFLEKPCSDATLWKAIQRSLEQSVEWQRITLIRYRLAQLTDSEQKVLNHILEGTPNEEMKRELGIALRTVELRRANIMKKVGAQSVAELVRFTLEARHAWLSLQGPHTRPSGKAGVHHNRRNEGTSVSADEVSD